MGRWIQPRQLITVGITLQEQIEWAEMGLSVYDLEGRCIIEHHQGKALPYGYKFLTSTDAFRFGDTFQYCKWEDTHSFFNRFQFKTNELLTFISSKKRQTRHIIYKYSENVTKKTMSPEEALKAIAEEEAKTPTILSEIYSPELAILLNIQQIHPQIPKQSLITPQIHLDTAVNKNQQNENNTDKDTSNAVRSHRISTAKAWAQDLELAVGLAVECAEAKKQKSTAQHRVMWEKRCAEKGVDSPRKEAFAAFRRGLPAHLKMDKD